MEVVEIKFNENMPIYLQIMNNIKENIINGTIGANEKLPSIRNYCSKYNVTSLTMQRAMSELEREGVVFTQKGIGSFVNKDVVAKLKKQMSKDIISGFVKNMKNMGFTKKEILETIKEELSNEQ